MSHAEVLLDTNAVSDFFRKRSKPVVNQATEAIAAHGRLTTSTITVFEFTRGFHRVHQPQRALAFVTAMVSWEVLPFDLDAAEVAGRIEAALRTNGTPIELADLFIAAIAVSAQRTLITHNTKHFEPIAALGFELPLADWTLPP